MKNKIALVAFALLAIITVLLPASTVLAGSTSTSATPAASGAKTAAAPAKSGSTGGSSGQSSPKTDNGPQIQPRVPIQSIETIQQREPIKARQ